MKNLILAVLTVVTLGSALIMASVKVTHGNPGAPSPGNSGNYGIDQSQTLPQ